LVTGKPTHQRKSLPDGVIHRGKHRVEKMFLVLRWFLTGNAGIERTIKRGGRITLP